MPTKQLRVQRETAQPIKRLLNLIGKNGKKDNGAETESYANEPKVTFVGTVEDMIKIAVKPINNKTTAK